jgi:nitrate reductase NapAB chaperone NapD
MCTPSTESQSHLGPKQRATTVPVSGLVITFSSDIAHHGETMEQLAGEPAIEIGDAVGPKLAIVVDSDTRDHDREIWNWVRNLPGIAMVDVAFVGFEETETSTDIGN